MTISNVKRTIEKSCDFLVESDPADYNGSLYDAILEEVDVIIEDFGLNYCHTNDVDDVLQHFPRYIKILEYLQSKYECQYVIQGSNVGVQLNTLVRHNLYMAIKSEMPDDVIQEWSEIASTLKQSCKDA